MLERKPKSIVLIQGYFGGEFFDYLRKRKIKEVFVLEGRPDFSASDKAVKELNKRNMKPTIISDNMAGFLFYKNLVKEVWLSYQMADKNGAVCQVGGMILGVLGKRHKVPVKLYESEAKFEMMGEEKEIFFLRGKRVAPNRIRGYVPKIEWLPKKYITEVVS